MDTIFYHGVVHTMAGRSASAIAVQGSRIALVGSDEEALSLLLRYAFDTLGLRRVELTVFAENSRARLCYLKAGFTEEGVARQKTWKNGKFHDIVSMAVLRDEWAKREEQA